MFTGIVEALGTVAEIARLGDAFRLTISAEAVPDDLAEGASIAVNGVCLTVLHPSPAAFSCDLSPETARLTNLGALRPGDRVNLERAMRLTGRLDGHLVSGHVEGVGRITAWRREENAVILSVAVPRHILGYCIPKGSIALDGVSMTINTLDETGVTVSVIPHTAAVTTLGIKGIGASVNLESDLIGRYVARLMRGSEGNPVSAFPGKPPSGR